VFAAAGCRNIQLGLRRSDRDRSRHGGQRHVHSPVLSTGGQHHVHSPVLSTGRSPDSKLDVVHRDSPTTSSRTRHMMSPGISARTRHGTAYRSRSPDDYKQSRDDLVKWTVGSDYESSQQQHSTSMVDYHCCCYYYYDYLSFFIYLNYRVLFWHDSST